MFLLGVLIFSNASYVPLHPLVFAGAVAGYYFLMIFDVLGPIAGLLLAYITVWIGMRNFPLFDRLVKVDVSYGIYLYGFPITQATIYFLFPHMTAIHGPLRFTIIFPLVLLLTVLFSSLSWQYIEKPTLALRRYFIPAGKPSAAIAAELTSPKASDMAK
jgi:peptidoglycan/LPS O-acetylase OafA/YrhL